MNEPLKLNGPQEHICHIDVRTWDKVKVYTCEYRKAPTLAENILWQELRGSKQGMKFCRQHAINFFIVHFSCVAAKLIIELDGEIHLTPEQAEYDLGRTFTLTELGYHELRFTNQQALTSLDNVLAKIAQSLKENYPEQPSSSPSLLERVPGVKFF